MAAMMEDPQVMRPPREPWVVRFSVGTVFVGCVVAATVFMGLVFVQVGGIPEEALEEAGLRYTPRQLAMMIGGFAAIGFLLLGPTVALGVGWLLRKVRTTSVHVLAFAVAGAVVGAGAGLLLGGPSFASLLAAPVGIAAAAGRLAVNPYAKIWG